MKKKAIRITILSLLLCAAALLLGGCGTKAGEGWNGGLLVDHLLSGFLPQESYEKSENKAVTQVKDDPSLYTMDATPVVMYLTVTPGTSAAGTNHTWQEINALGLTAGENPARCAALLQVGNETGPVYGAYGFSDRDDNATVRLSGLRSSRRQQKSYRVELNENNGNISGMKEFILSKSFTDPFRLTNKLAFDLMASAGTMLSVRTFFVHLYVRDLTAAEDTKFVDYGLYTMVEPVNKRYLKNRSLDHTGELYKVVNFDFGRHEDVIMQPTDAAFDQKRFEALLEAKGSSDYSGLIAMLEAVNDESVPIQDTVNAYFDEGSLFRFLAVNILLDNKDTDTENFILYRPLGDSRFYIIPWDFDGSLRKDYEAVRDPDYAPGWEQGIYLYTESVLFRRIMESEYCTNILSGYITELHNSVFSGNSVQSRAEKLAKTVLKYLYVLPDRAYARVTETVYGRLLSRLAEQIDENFYTYYDTLMTPRPFHILWPETGEDGEITLRWEASGAMSGGVTYDLELDDAWDFSSPLLKAQDLTETSFPAGKLSEGQYFLRVRAKSEQGYSQEAYEYYNTEKKSVVPGVLCFYVAEGGGT